MRGSPGAAELLSSYVPAEDGPRGFHLSYGFVETGPVEAGEREITLTV